jgi:hypothetical protein
MTAHLNLQERISENSSVPGCQGHWDQKSKGIKLTPINKRQPQLGHFPTLASHRQATDQGENSKWQKVMIGRGLCATKGLQNRQKQQNTFSINSFR